MLIQTDERIQYVDGRSDDELFLVIIVWPENVFTRVVPLIGGGLCVPTKKYLFKKNQRILFFCSYLILPLRFGSWKSD